MKKVYLIATFVAILAGIATYFFATQIQQNTKIKDAPTSPVVVALVEIKENTVITAEMVAVKYFTTVSVTPNAAKDLTEVVGKLNRYPIALGEQILLKKVITLGDMDNNAALSYQLKTGEYAYTVSVDSVSGVSGFITKGDYVDIVYTTAVDGAISSSILMSDIRVIKISNFAANAASDAPNGSPITSYSEVIFNLNKKQIVDLTKALSLGRITLALKPITSGEDVSQVAVVTTKQPG